MNPSTLPASPSDARGGSPADPPEAAPAQARCDYWDFCPNCGQRLQNRGCKYRCPRCHYFMSCSDFD